MKRNKKSEKYIGAFMLMPLLIFIFVLICIIAPQFYPYLLFLIGLAAIFYIISRHLHRITASQCASCKGALTNLGVQRVYGGKLNEDGISRFSPVAIKVYKCDDCNKEYHELIYFSGGTVESTQRYRMNFPYVRTMIHVMGEVPDSIDKDFNLESAQEQYMALKRKLAKQVVEHNRKNGYISNPIKIDLDSNK